MQHRSRLLLLIGGAALVIAIGVIITAITFLNAVQVPAPTAIVAQQPTRRPITDVPVVGVQASPTGAAKAVVGENKTDQPPPPPADSLSVGPNSAQGASKGPTIGPGTPLPTRITVNTPSMLILSPVPGQTSGDATEPAPNVSTPEPTTAPPNAAFYATPGPSDTVPLNFANVGVGKISVVSASYPVTANGNNQWLQVELLMTCTNKTNCSPAPAALKVVGDSGTTYDFRSDSNIEPRFGPDAFAQGQTWGYATFIVPPTETGLRLTLTQAGTVYTFTLR